MNEDETPDDQGLVGRAAEIVSGLGGATAAARHLSVSRNTLDLWLKRKSKIPLDGATKLAQLGGKSLDWLVHGREAVPPVAVDETMGLPDGFVTVPMLRVGASAGPGRITNGDDLVPGEVAAFREDWLRSMGLIPGRTHVLTAVGDSMEPTIRNGDFLLVDRSVDRVVDNGIYVVVLAGLVLVKRVQVRLSGALVLKSENPVYGEEVVPPDAVDDVVIEGRVRWYGRGI